MMGRPFPEECRPLAIAGAPDADKAPLSGQLPEPVAARLLQQASCRQLCKGAALYDVGSAPSAMYGVLAGTLEVSVHAADGRRFLAGRVGPGQWFGEVPLLDGGQRVYRALAQTDVEVAVLSAARFEALIAADPQLLLAVARLACGRYRMALSWIEDAVLKPLPARLAARLLVLHGLLPSHETQIVVAQDDLAAQLGSSRQSINRLLKQWQRAGWLDLHYGGLALRERAPLQALAG